MDFWRAVGILNNRKWLIVLSVIAATTLTWGATRLVGAKYVAEVKFMSLSGAAVSSTGGKMPSGEADSSVQPGQGSQKDVDKKQLATIDAIMKSEKVITQALANM